jgi:hypothetical protein
MSETELRKVLEGAAGELAKHAGIVSHEKCERVTISCPVVVISSPCEANVICIGYEPFPCETLG